MALLTLWGFDDSFGEPGVTITAYHAGRNGIGSSAQCSGDTGTQMQISFRNLCSATNKTIIGFAINNFTGEQLEIVDVGTNQMVNVGYNSVTGTMDFYDKNSNHVGSFEYSTYINSWVYLEMIIDVPGQQLTVYLEGKQMFSGHCITNAQAPGALKCGPAFSQSGTYYLDDMYLADNTGAAPYNAPLGDVFVRSVYPSGNGTNSQWTNSAGNNTNNYSYVDENPSSITTYVAANATGLQDEYTNSGLTVGLVPLAVQPIALGAIDVAGSAPAVSIGMNDGTNTELDAVGPFATSAALFNGTVHEAMPNGGVWTAAGLAALSIEVTT